MDTKSARHDPSQPTELELREEIADAVDMEYAPGRNSMLERANRPSGYLMEHYRSLVVYFGMVTPEEAEAFSKTGLAKLIADGAGFELTDEYATLEPDGTFSRFCKPGIRRVHAAVVGDD
jgi:hypothetical protein